MADNPQGLGAQLLGVDEGVGTAVITVRRLNGSDGAVSVRCGTTTASAGYSATMNTLSWANGDSANKTCTASIDDDSIDEPNEAALVTLSNVTGGATLGTPSTATLVDGHVGSVVIAIRRRSGSAGAATILCETTGGTATAGADNPVVRHAQFGKPSRYRATVPSLDLRFRFQ